MLIQQERQAHRDLTLSSGGGTPARKETKSGEQGAAQSQKGNNRACVWVDQAESKLPPMDGTGLRQCKGSVVVAMYDHKSEKTLQVLDRRLIAAVGMLSGERERDRARVKPTDKPVHQMVNPRQAQVGCSQWILRNRPACPLERYPGNTFETASMPCPYTSMRRSGMKCQIQCASV